MNYKKITVKLKHLQVCPKLSDLRKVNLVFVSRYRQAYRTGAHMPPLKVQRIKNNLYRIVSGNHRYRALVAEFGKDFEIEVLLGEYANERAILEDFVHENANHGNALDGITRRRLTHELLKEDVTAEEIAVLFNIPVQRIERWEGTGIVTVLGPNKQKTDEFVKRGYQPQATPITRAEYKQHLERDRGLSVVQQATQLTRWIYQNAIERSEVNIIALSELHSALGEFFKAQEKTA